MFAAVEPVALGLAIASFVLVFVLTRRVWIGSLVLGTVLALAVVLREPDTAFGARLPVTVAAIAAGLLLFWTHRSNIRKARSERVSA